MNIDDIIPIPREKFHLSIALDIILNSDCADDLEHCITFLRKNDYKSYLRIKDIVEKHLSHEIFGDRR